MKAGISGEPFHKKEHFTWEIYIADQRTAAPLHLVFLPVGEEPAPPKKGTFYVGKGTFYVAKGIFYVGKGTFYVESKSRKPLIYKALRHFQKS